EPTRAVAIGDVTGDGRADLLVAANPLQLLRQKPDGTLAPPVAIGSLGPAYSVSAVDVDGDGKLDAAYPTEKGVAVAFQRGGTLAAPVIVSGPQWIEELAAGDVNGDGRVDFVVSGFDNGTFALLNTGAGFAP